MNINDLKKCSAFLDKFYRELDKLPMETVIGADVLVDAADRIYQREYSDMSERYVVTSLLRNQFNFDGKQWGSAFYMTGEMLALAEKIYWFRQCVQTVECINSEF